MFCDFFAFVSICSSRRCSRVPDSRWGVEIDRSWGERVPRRPLLRPGPSATFGHQNFSTGPILVDTYWAHTGFPLGPYFSTGPILGQVVHT